MGKVTPALQKVLYTVLLLCCVKIGKGQTLPSLRLTEYAIWGGSAAPTSYKKDSAVIFNNSAVIQGNIGSNHLIDIKNNLVITGSLYSGNLIIFKNLAKITGNVVANRLGTTANPGISGGDKDTIIGNLMSTGKITLGTGKVTGKVYVPAPTGTNYKGPAPSAGFQTSFTPPGMPGMPNNNNFDYLVAANTPANNVTNPATPLQPGVYRKLALTGNKTLTFDGPGNYIFYEIDNGTTTNKIVFDFKTTTEGNINIFVIKDARWGFMTVTMKNGNFPGRIYTEVHGTGSSFGTGYAFDLQGPTTAPAGSNLWLGNVWAPFGGINFVNTPLLPVNTPHVIGTLWSRKKVNIKNDFRMVYQAPTFPDLGFVDPYYNAPVGGKTDDANNSTGPELLALSNSGTNDSIRTKQNNEIFIIKNNDKVLIEVISKNENDLTLKQDLITLGMTDENGQPGTIDNGPHTYVQSGYLPIIKISDVKNNSKVKYVRPLYPPLFNKEGQTGTQGDTTMKSFLVRERFGANGPLVDGTGVKIGVISDSYNANDLAAQDDVAQGDLPDDVQLLEPNLEKSGTDEGRAMLQIVHDIAPKAKLAFHTGSLGAGPLAKTIQQMASSSLPGGKCDVIVDDLTYLTEPFNRDGIVAQTVNQVVRDNNVVYVTSAGNFGRQAYEAVFKGVANANVLPGVEFHNFEGNNSPNKIYQNLNLKPGSYTIVLQWEDGSASLGNPGGVLTDLDLYLLSAAGFIKFGFNRSSLTLDPYEVCAFTVREESNVKLVVARAAGSANVRFKYIIFRGDATILDYPNSNKSTIVGHANADSAITVGAMLYANIQPFTPVWPGVASFSSRGGTFTVTNPNSPSPTYAQRLKPDIIAANGVNTTVPLGGASFNDGDPYPNFFGTSAAAPHIAAVAGLLIQGQRLFNQQTTVEQTLIRQKIRTSAGKFAGLGNGHSFEGGYGFVQADSAMLQIANARPIISTLEAVPSGAQNGTDSFVVKIKGQYLNDSTKIYVGGGPMKTTVSANKTEATAKIAAITGQDPAFQLFNPAKSVSGIDGGLSEAKFFFSSKVNITVRAENKTKKYGQNNPPLTVQILRNGLLVSSPDSIDKYKLNLETQLDVTTIATSTSRAALYGIVPSRTSPLAPNDPLLTQYDFTFVSGTLIIEKMPLLVKIIPKSREVKFGDFPGEVTYAYNLSQSANNASALLAEAESAHKKYLADNGLIVLHGFNATTTNLQFISKMSTLASFQSVRNSRDFIVDGSSVSPLPDQRFFVDVSAQSLTNFKQDSSYATMVEPLPGVHGRGLLSIKALAKGGASAQVPNGQLKAMVNGQVMEMINGQLQAVVNGQLKAVVNGATVDAADMVFQNGQLLAQVNGVWVVATNGQLKAVVNGEDLTVYFTVETNGQLKAVVNGQTMAEVNGHLESTVNGQLLAVVNGQLKAVVNGQLMPMVNGQLKAVVNGQLLAVVNGQLKAVVNGQLMAVVNGELQIIDDLVYENGQLKAVVNGQLQAVVNGQLKAMVNGAVNDVTNVTNDLQVSLTNGLTLPALNGQLKAVVNGEQQPLPNSFDTNNSNNNNSRTAVVIDQDDINLQLGDIGGLFSMPMITGLEPGVQTLVAGAFLSDNFEVAYDTCKITITKRPVSVVAENKTRIPGASNPPLTISYSGFAGTDDQNSLCIPVTESITVSTNANLSSPIGDYPITLADCSSHNPNYAVVLVNGKLTVGYPCNTSGHVWNGDGNFNDSEGSGHGNAEGGATATGNGLIGSNSFSFDGSTGYIATGTAGSVSGTGDFFVSAWIKTTSNAPMVIINQRGADIGDFGTGFDGEYYLKIGGTHYEVSQGLNAGKAYFFMYDFDNNPYEVGILSTTLVNDGNWHHIKGERSGNITRLYVDGVLEGTATSEGVINLNGTIPTYIGADVRDNASYFNGLIDDIRVAVCPGASLRPAANSVPLTTKVRVREDKLFPNPATSSLRLILKDDLRSAAEIRVFDAVGKMQSASVRKLSEGNFDVNVSRLAQGVYFITAKTPAGMKTFRFIKL